jgi:hypothetical protein
MSCSKSGLTEIDRKSSVQSRTRSVGKLAAMSVRLGQAVPNIGHVFGQRPKVPISVCISLPSVNGNSVTKTSGQHHPEGLNVAKLAYRG